MQPATHSPRGLLWTAGPQHPREASVSGLEPLGPRSRASAAWERTPGPHRPSEPHGTGTRTRTRSTLMGDILSPRGPADPHTPPKHGRAQEAGGRGLSYPGRTPPFPLAGTQGLVLMGGPRPTPPAHAASRKPRPAQPTWALAATSGCTSRELWGLVPPAWSLGEEPVGASLPFACGLSGGLSEVVSGTGPLLPRK